MSTTRQTVQDFFNALAESYKERYSRKLPFHFYFFTERLEKSLANVELQNASVLDVGAGTGPLYDALSTQNIDFSYFANDIAEHMLERSQIPVAQRFVGSVTDVDFPNKKFNLVFMLGVSTYLTRNEFEEQLAYFQKQVDEDGLLVISFTNKHSLDGFLRWMWKPVARIFSRKKRVLTSSLKIEKYSAEEVGKLLEDYGFKVEKLDYLNHTVFPFNLLLPRFAVWLSQRLGKIKNPRLLSWMSSDFLVRGRKGEWV
jgi:SAM-dependent methyltransferase